MVLHNGIVAKIFVEEAVRRRRRVRGRQLVHPEGVRRDRVVHSQFRPFLIYRLLRALPIHLVYTRRAPHLQPAVLEMMTRHDEPQPKLARLQVAVLPGRELTQGLDVHRIRLEEKEHSITSGVEPSLRDSACFLSLNDRCSAYGKHKTIYGRLFYYPRRLEGHLLRVVQR